MPDPLDEVVRRRMERQGRRDSSVELAIRRTLHGLGYRFRVDYRLELSLRCRGDIVFPKRRVVVFIDGCFWHGCPQHATSPKHNADWWRGGVKLTANAERDRQNTEALTALGWTVLRIWEHESILDSVESISTVLKKGDAHDSHLRRDFEFRSFS